jgi:hypothetical protein
MVSDLQRESKKSETIDQRRKDWILKATTGRKRPSTCTCRRLRIVIAREPKDFLIMHELDISILPKSIRYDFVGGTHLLQDNLRTGSKTAVRK